MDETQRNAEVFNAEERTDELETALYEIIRSKHKPAMRQIARKAISGKRPGSVARMEHCIKELERELGEAKTEQNAWYKIFGTQQLTHAVAGRDQLRAERDGLVGALAPFAKCEVVACQSGPVSYVGLSSSPSITRGDIVHARKVLKDSTQAQKGGDDKKDDDSYCDECRNTGHPFVDCQNELSGYDYRHYCGCEVGQRLEEKMKGEPDGPE